MVRRRFVGCLTSASVAAMAFAPSPAAAQHIDRIVAIGDSYADTENLWQLLGIAPPSPYLTGRFSGGTNYIDTLSQILNVPVDNFAIGGALTNNTNTNSPFLPGFTYEYSSFLAGGGGVFPAVDGTFDQHDLLAVSIGGNDARTYETGNAGLGVLPGTLAGAPAAATIAAANATIGLNALVDAGAPTISYLAVNTALAPEVAGRPSPATAAAIRDSFATTFNAALQQSLAGYAADGVIVHYLDLSLIGARIAEDPEAYGLANSGPCPLASATQCVTDPTFVNQYLFYVDGLHLTSAGFAIVANYVATQLNAPLTLRAQSDAGLDTARQFGRTLSSRTDLYNRDAAPEGTRFYVLADMFSRDVPASDNTNSFDIDGVGGTIGAEFGLGNAMVGVAGNYTHGRVRYPTQVSRTNGNSWQIGAYGGVTSGNLFGQAYLGFGKDKYRITRTGVIDDMTARPSGSHVTAGAKGGMLFPIGSIRVGPVVGVDYARAKVDAYQESGDPALTLNVSKQSLKALTGQFGIEGRFGLLPGMHSYASIAAEHEFSGDSRLIEFSQTASPTIINTWDVERAKETYGRMSSGASFDLWQGAQLNTSLSRTVGRDDGQEFGGQLGFRMLF